jgi:pyridoxal phosphate enzyme (YggS family)
VERVEVAGSGDADAREEGRGGGAAAPLPVVDAAAVAERVALVRQRLDTLSVGGPVRIVAVTKGFGSDAVDAAVAAGLTSVAENYAQELAAKAGAGAGGPTVRWHFIGAIQRNKVAQAAPFVAMWQSVDRPAVIDAIARHSPGATVLVQVNLTGEEGRSGCRWADAPAVVGAARAAGLEVRGLMGIGPAGAPDAGREVFTALAALTRRLGLADVSMGMSDDFETAVRAGSTMIRLGTVLFGPRPRRGDLRR